MPLYFEIDRERGLVVTRAEGRVTPADLLEHANALAKTPDRPLRELVDFSDRSELGVPTGAVRRTGDYLCEADANAPGSKLAMVAPNDSIFGILRLYQAHREHDAIEIRVFRDRGEALAWLGVSDAEGARQLNEST